MKVYSIFRSGRFFVLLCLFIVEGKRLPTGKHTCRKGLLFQVTENLYIKATSLKSSVPTEILGQLGFRTNCSVRDQLLSFYVKNVFTHLGVGSERLYVISAFQALQENLSACVSIFPRAKRLGEKGIYKAIHELDILLPWIQAYIQTVI
uniref:IL26 protein n=1 Tax=Dromaius novaehollandiae TaxID=8790 RepID=A0A8C4K3K6_DRONO